MTLSAVLPAADTVRAVPGAASVAGAASTGCHTLTVTVRDGGHALTRISAMLNNLSVRALSYRAADSGGFAVCEIVVPAADSPRAQAKLLRCVEIVELTAHPAA